MGSRCWRLLLVVLVIGVMTAGPVVKRAHAGESPGFHVRYIGASLGTKISSPVVADLDGDGWKEIVASAGPDLIVLGWQGSEYRVVLVARPFEDDIACLAAADHDQDGLDELFVAAANRADILVFRWEDSALRRVAAAEPLWSTPRRMAVTRDARAQTRLVVGTNDGLVFVYTLEGEELLAEWCASYAGEWGDHVVEGLLATDLDGDGLEEIVLGTAGGLLVVLRQNEAGYGEVWRNYVWGEPGGMAVGRFCRADREAVAVTTSRGMVYLFEWGDKNDGLVQVEQSGLLELYGQCWAGVSALPGGEDDRELLLGAAGEALTVASLESPHAVALARYSSLPLDKLAVADLNGDGTDEIVGMTADGRLVLLEKPSLSSFGVVEVLVDGEAIGLRALPVVVEGRIFLPVAEIYERLGFSLEKSGWRCLELSKNGWSVQFVVRDDMLEVWTGSDFVGLADWVELGGLLLVEPEAIARGAGLAVSVCSDERRVEFYLGQ